MKIYVQKPRYRTILFNTRQYPRVFLPLPYVIFTFSTNYDDLGIQRFHCRAAFANKSPRRKDVKLYSIPFSNITSNFAVCLGKTRFKSDYEALARFWGSCFNRACVNPFYDPTLKNQAEKFFSRWKKLSLEQIVKVKWQEKPLAITDFCYPEDITVEYI